MKLTDRQRDKAEQVRGILDVQQFVDCFLHFDLTDSIGRILEGAERLIQPDEMARQFNLAWNAYASIWNGELNAVCQNAVGDKALWERVKKHPNGREAVSGILDRILAVHGEIVPSMKIEVDVSDILVDCQIE